MFLLIVNDHVLLRPQEQQSSAVCTKGPSIKDVGMLWAVFDTPFPYVRILTWFSQLLLSNILQHRNLRTALAPWNIPASFMDGPLALAWLAKHDVWPVKQAGYPPIMHFAGRSCCNVHTTASALGNIKQQGQNIFEENGWLFGIFYLKPLQLQ